MTSEELQTLLDAATPGPWAVVEYDAGDRAHYDHNGPCPSIQAPDDQDCAVVHWDGFKQKYWSAANGNQKQITANARAIATWPTLAAELIAARVKLAAAERLAEATKAQHQYMIMANDRGDLERNISNALAAWEAAK